MRSKVKFFEGDKVIWFIYFSLLCISILEVFSAASSLSYKSGDYWHPVNGHAAYLMLGLLCLQFVSRIRYNSLMKFTAFIIPLSVILLVTVFFAKEVNGAVRWINIFGIRFQPSEIAKLALIITVASLLAKGQLKKDGNQFFFHSTLIMTGLICGLIAPEDMSTAALLFCTIFIMMFIGCVDVKSLFKIAMWILVPLIFMMMTAFVVPQKYLEKVPLMNRSLTWKNRITNFVNENDSVVSFDEKNAQKSHAQIAIARSNIVTKPFQSIQRDFLSQAYSDYIYSIVIEDLGLLGGAFIIFLYILLLTRSWKIAQQSSGPFGRLLVMGLSSMIVIQALCNMAVAVGLFPVTGQTLPLISRGGTSIITNSLAVGLILSVSRSNELQNMTEENQNENSNNTL
jgi:cell division protein FtsW